MRISLPVVLTSLLLAGSLKPTCVLAEEPDTNRAATALARVKSEMELNILKREYETLRIARVDQVKLIEFMKIDIDSYKDRSLRQRELGERLVVLQEQLKSLDRMIDEARARLDDALKQALSGGESGT